MQECCLLVQNTNDAPAPILRLARRGNDAHPTPLRAIQCPPQKTMSLTVQILDMKDFLYTENITMKA